MKLNLKLGKSSQLNQIISPKIKVFLVPVIVLVVFFAVGFLIIRPKINDILEIREENNLNKEKLTRLESKLDTLRLLNPNKLRLQLDTANTLLPSTKDPASLIITMEKLAVDSGVSVESFAVTPGGISTESAQSQKSDGFNFKIAIKGSYANLKDFLANSLKTARLLAIKAISMSTRGSDELNITTEIAAFYSPLPKITAKADEPVSSLSNQEEKLIEELDQFASTYQIPVSTSSPRINPFAPF